MSEEGIFENLLDKIVWIILFILLLLGVYFLLKNLIG